MDLTIRVQGLTEPAGEVDLLRLERFISNFRTGVLRSAQADQNVPAFKRALDGEEVPRFRLIGITDGSTALVMRSADERPVTIQSVSRHVQALDEYQRTGSWPPYMYPGERQAWGQAYGVLVTATRANQAVITLNGTDVTIDRATVTALEQAPVTPALQEVVVIGDLHLIDVGGAPHFNIRTPDLDLRFDLTDEIRELVDRNRWHRVQAQARWEMGSNRATLVGDLAQSDDPAGLTVIGDVAGPEWVRTQVARLERFGLLRRGWLETDTPPPAQRRLASAAELSRQIARTFGDQALDRGPYFGPTDDGSVGFEWRLGERLLVCEIGQRDFELTATEGSEEAFEGVVDQRGLFSWIGWLLGGDRPA